jgi:hypothetical protein
MPVAEFGVEGVVRLEVDKLLAFISLQPADFFIIPSLFFKNLQFQ